MREIKRCLAAAAALILVLALVPAAESHQSPATCVKSNPVVRFASETINQAGTVRQGDSIDLGARVSNLGPGACDLSGITIKVRLPNPDGSPGEIRTLASNVSVDAGGVVEGFTGTPPYVVNLDEGVFGASMSISWETTVHDGDPESVISGEGNPLRFELTRPRTSLQIEADKPSGAPPLKVGFTYSLTNLSPLPTSGTSAPALVPDGPDGPYDLLSDAACAPLVYLSGDQTPSGDPNATVGPVLDPGETWKFTCSRTYLLPGTYENQPLITGSSSVDLRPWPQPASGFSPVTVLGSDLTVSKSHQGDLLAGGKGTFSIGVTNTGNLASSGAVTVADQIPAGLVATSVSGEGWTCDLTTVSCSRSDSLAIGASYPPVTVKVRVATDPPSTVVNTATVTGGAEPQAATTNNSASDPVTIRKPTQPEPPKGKVFSLGKATPLGNGLVSLRVRVPSAGLLVADDAKKPDLVRTTRARTRKAGNVKLVLKANRKLRRALTRSGGSRRVRIRVSFAAAGNPPSVSPVSAFRLVSFDLRPPA